MTTDTAIDLDTVESLSAEDIGHIGPTARVFAQQNTAFWAERRYEDTIYTIENDPQVRQAMRNPPLGSSTTEVIENHPQVREARQAAETARQAARQAQDAIGGIVFCVESQTQLPKAEKRIASLARKAGKLDSEAITLKVTDEHVTLHYAYEDNREGPSSHADFDHVFVILSGGTPKIPGWEFLATVQHTEAGNIVRRIPSIRFGFRRNLTEDAAQQAVDSIDLTPYRYTGALCEHCGLERQRVDTYVVYNDETGETKQVGRTCLRDFTGANNPEAIVKYLQQVWEAMRGMSERGETPPLLTRTFLVHVAAVMRSEGKFEPRNGGTGTADYAMSNIFDQRDQRKDRDGRQMWIEPTEQDERRADEILAWALNSWDDDSEFAHNVRTMLASPVLPSRGAGYAASVYSARERYEARQKAQAAPEQERQDATPVLTGKQTITGTILSTEYRDNDFGGKQVMTVKDDRGFKVWGTMPHALNSALVDQMRAEDEADFGSWAKGRRIRFNATVEKSDRDESFGFFRRPTRGEVLAA